MVCQSDGTSITAVFRWPPRRFMMSLMDVTILQLFENRSHFRNNSTRIVLSVSVLISKQLEKILKSVKFLKQLLIAGDLNSPILDCMIEYSVFKNLI